ncbi:autotransporter beta-domain protein [Selenomonas sp. FOBRC6]|uniref:autotransporter outer membrane beta-barrel domain-containing protein n=1 Tax=Selenomonas sp. FOBRC6 TaxID=936572 RepID=UPI00027828AD|nr:autotransporter outer membrane beta-barrel domain-containing protein [Selenomonas sp. FOBRC6]EJO22601.1 autotransporter beta-domain protein [Selenomonas sp. FOBRC6]
MTKGFFRKRSRLQLSALVLGGLFYGSTACAADLVATVPSDYTSSDIGAVTGSRVTTNVDAAPRKAVMKDQGGDVSLFNFHQDGTSRLIWRKYGFSATALPSLLLDPNTLGTDGAKLAEGAISASPNTHSVAASGNFIYATGYDLGKIGVAKKTGASLVEDASATIDLKSDIKNHAGYNFNGTYDITANDDTVTQKTGSESAAKVHGEALLIDGNNLYAAASINPDGTWDSYDDGYLLHYEIQSDGKLEYKSSARIGRNVGNRISKFNDTLFVPSFGGKQTAAGNKHHTEITVVTRDNTGILTSSKHIMGKDLMGTGEDIRDIKVMPNGTAYILAFNMPGSATGHVYQTTVSNLLSDTPDKVDTPIAELKDGGAIGQFDAEYYTKRLWVSDGANLKVYTDGDTTPKKTWAATNFASSSARGFFNNMAMLAPDHVTGPLATVNLTPPAEIGGAPEAAAPNPNAVWKTGGDYTDTIAKRPTENWMADKLVNIGTDKIGDKKTNVLAAISNTSLARLNLGKFALALQLQVENSVGNPTGIYAGNGKNVIVNGKEVNIITRGREGGNTLTNAVHLDAAKDTEAQITINAPLNISMTGGLGGNGVAIQKSDRHGEKSYEASVGSTIKINGNLKIAGANTNEWGIPLNRENIFSRFNNAGILTQVEKSDVTVTGNVDMTVYGNGATANAVGSTIRIAEGGSIQVPAGTKYSYYALAAYQGEISMNMGKDGTKPGNEKTGSNIADVKLDGDLFALSTGKLKAALLTNKSYLHGLVDNGGEADLYLKNGAKWINESRNERYYQDIEDVGAGTVSEGAGKKVYTPKTRVTHFHGGDTAETHGIIYQKDKQSLDIDEYSGHTTVVYEHDTATPTTIKGGDIVVDKAVGTENVMTLFTDNNGVSGQEDAVLNALAGKLTYKSHADGKLTGKLSLAEGLTASAAHKNITFKTSGKGSYVSPAAEHHAPITAADATGGTYTLTTDERRDLTQAEAGFGFNSKHAALANYTQNASGNTVTDLTVDLAGHKLTLGMTSGNRNVATVYAGKGTSPSNRSKLTITDAQGTGELVLSAEATVSKQVNAIRAEQNAEIDIQAPVKITSVKAPFNAQAISAANNSSITMKELILSQVDGPGNTTAANKNVYGIGLNGKSTTITVTENADITDIKGISLYSQGGADNHSKLSVGGGRIITPEDATNSKNYWAVYAVKGNVFLNEGKNRDLTVVGNMQAGETDTAVVDASFTSSTSSWKGAIHRKDKSAIFPSTTNLTLTNGATWTHEVQSGILKGDSSFTTSRLTKFTGGDAADRAGVVQQGEKNIEIDNYSGYTRFIFAHDAATPTTIKGGNVTITSAEAGSHLTFSTDPNAVTNSNVKDVLKALANKLYYAKYKEGETNLSGTVEVNEGLISSAAKWAGAITYNGSTGQGTYDENATPSQPSNEQQKTEFTSQIKSDNVGEYVTAKVEKTKGIYTFTKDTTIKTDRYNGAILGGSEPITINAADKTLTIEAKKTGNGFLTGIYHYGSGMGGETAGTINITAKALNINAEGVGKTYGINNLGNSLLRVHGDTNITVKGGTGNEVTGIEASGSGITQLDGLTLKQEKSSNAEHRAIRNVGKGSRIFVNMDEAGVLGMSKVEIQGNVLTHGEDAEDGKYPLTSFALTTADSRLTGTIVAGAKGKADLYLQNGGSWYNEHYGTRPGLVASRLTKLTGGSDTAHAGNVYMKEAKDLTIANYAGHTNFFFEHDAGTPNALKGGNVKVEKAEAGSHATMITEHTGVTSSNLTNVLKALAKKLYYMDSADSRNLSGTVKVLEGLTASSAQMTGGFGYIAFGADHRGEYSATAPVYHDQTIENFTAPITNTAADTVYASDGVRKIDGSYVFTKDRTSITTNGVPAAITNNDTMTPLSIDMKGHDLTVSASNTAAVAGISADGKEITVKNAGNLDIAALSTGSSAVEAKDGGKVTIESREGKTVRLRAESSTPANTAVVRAAATGARSSVKINGAADIEAGGVKAAAALDASSSDISVAGGTIRATNGALMARSSGTTDKKGRIDINVTTDSAGTVTGAGANKTVLEGDLSTANGVINIGLNTADSSWKGNSAGEVNLRMGNDALWEGKTEAASQLNMTHLASGARWNLTGTSHVKNLAASNMGGRSVFDMTRTAAGDKLTIDNFSGKGHFLYGNTVTTTHDPDTETNVKHVTVNGGEIRVKKAAAGSAITLHTDAKSNATGGWNWTTSGTPAEQNLTSSVVKQLANKLYYEDAAANGNNLALTVKVGEGLTTSSTARTYTKSDGLRYNTATGQADYAYTPVPEPLPTTEIKQTKTLTKNYTASATEAHAKDDGGNPIVSALYPGASSYDKTTPMVVDMNGHTLRLEALSSEKLARAISLSPNSAVEIKNDAGKELTIKATNTSSRAATAIYTGANASLKVKGPVVIEEVSSSNPSVSGITTGGSIGNTSDVLIDGSLTIKKLEGRTSGSAGDGRNLSALHALNGKSTITVTGNADIQNVKGSVLRVAGSTGYEAGGTINISGGILSAAADADKSKQYRVVSQTSGKVNINMNGAGVGAKKTVLKGDMYTVSSYGKRAVEYGGGTLIDYQNDALLNVALTTSDSSWHGARLYEENSTVPDAGGFSALKAANFNFYLQNGAQWTNEQLSKADQTWAGSRVTKFTGGSDADHAGVIFQKDAKPITIDSYSGHTKVLYAHEAGTPTNIIGGDLTIGKAAANSAVTLTTDSTGLNTASTQAADKNLVSATLNALAKKLYYTAYTTNERNLTGKVEIAEGLTASSASKRLENITFSAASGQGSYAYTPAVDPQPNPQTQTEFTTPITGDAAHDIPYVNAGIRRSDGQYIFTKDTTIRTDDTETVSGGPWAAPTSPAISNVNTGRALDIDLNGKKLNIEHRGNTTVVGINAIGKDSQVNVKNPGAITISGTNTDSLYAPTLYVNGGGSIHIQNGGDNLEDKVLTLRTVGKKEASPAVIKSMNGASGVESSITIDGLVDLLADGTYPGGLGANEGVSAVASRVDIGGGSIRATGSAWAAIRAYGEFVTENYGTVNFNVTKGADGLANGAGKNRAVLEGDIVTNGGMGTKGRVSIGLSTPESHWIGNYADTHGYGVTQGQLGVVNLFMKNGSYWKGFSNGVMNMEMSGAGTRWTGFNIGENLQLNLANGAVWYNAITPEQKNQDGTSAISRVKHFSGSGGFIDMTGTNRFLGESTSLSGHFVKMEPPSSIIEKGLGETGDLTINSFSGDTKVLYRHDAASPTTVYGGKLTIAKAAAGSAITLSTDSVGLNTESTKAADKNLVSATLNALANKLYYTAYTTGEKNLSGKAEIAEGLTTSAASKRLENITFSKESGQGSYAYTPAVDPKPDTPKPDTPKPDVPKPDTPKPDVPKPDVPKPDTPKPDTPKPDVPKPDTPKPDTPKPDTPKPDTPKPDTPKPDTPKPDTPKPDTPKPDTPKPDVPKPDTPKPDTPKPDTPKPDTPKPDTPKPDVPKPDTPRPDPKIEYGDYETKLMSGVKSAMTASTMAWRAEANDLMKRMGDLRLSPQDAGVWARVYRGKATSNKDNANFRMNYSTIQVGYDKKVGDDWRVGVAGSYMSGSSSYTAGNGKNKEGNLGVYGTWTGKSGQYVDLIAKIGRLQNEYTVYNDFGHYVKGDYTMWGGSLSAEYGKRIAMTGGTFVEPQVELIYSHMQGKSYVGSTDFRGMSMYVHQKPFDSFIGRVGFGIGKETERSTCYARVSLYHEFAGDMHTDYSDGFTPKSTVQRGSDTWVGVQLGGTMKLNDRTNLYGNFEKTFGGDIQTAWRMDAGLRWNF